VTLRGVTLLFHCNFTWSRRYHRTDCSNKRVISSICLSFSRTSPSPSRSFRACFHTHVLSLHRVIPRSVICEQRLAGCVASRWTKMNRINTARAIANLAASGVRAANGIALVIRRNTICVSNKGRWNKSDLRRQKRGSGDGVNDKRSRN